MKFKNLYEQTKEDVELSLLSLWTPGLHRMRPAIKDLLQREPLMAEPVFQSMFPWELTKDHNWTSYLDSQVITDLKIGTAAGGYEPRQLQTDSWKELAGGNSIVVTSGTGSGKTECFLYPVLSDLFSRRVQNGNDPVGAIFLYPLNALMQDQKERLGECCQTLGLKFAVYNSSLEENQARVPSRFPAAEVMTRERVRTYDNNNASCPQILLTNPSMLEYMLVRDNDNPIFNRSQGALRWIVIDEAHTYTGSAAVELAYLIKRVLQAFGVTRDQVRFVCTSATIGDPKKPQQLIDFITSIIGDYSSPSIGKKLVPIGGNRIVAPLAPLQIQKELNAQGITETTGAKVYMLRNRLNLEPMTLSCIWGMLTGKNWTTADTKDALNLLDKLCDIKIGNDCLLMARGHFFMRNIEGLYACVNTQCSGRNHLSHLGFDYLTTYKGNGKCPHCGAPLLEVVQCGDCKEFLLACEENDNGEIRPTHNDRWSSAGDKNEDTLDDEDEEKTDGGTRIDDTWERQYLAFYDDCRPYAKPHPNRRACRIAFKWDGNVLKTDTIGALPWVMLQDDSGLLYCPTCAKGSGEDGRQFARFHSSSDWLNGALAPSLLKESVPVGAGVGVEWGKYIAFTDSRQGTAIYAKRFNVDAERAYARARITEALSNPNNNNGGLIQALIAAGLTQAQAQAQIAQMPLPTTLPNYTMQQTADCIFNQDMFNHIEYDISKSKSANQHQQSVDGYKSALLRGIVGRKPVHVANMENLGLITICYPAIDNMQQGNLPNICQTMGIALQDWKDFLKICLDYYVRMGNHLQCASVDEISYMRDSDKSTPFEDWPSVNVRNGGQISLHQNRLVTLLCAGLGIHNVAILQQRKTDVDRLLAEAFAFLSNNVLSRVDANDPYYNVSANYNDWYYLDMSPTSDKCNVKLTEEAWLCPVTNFLLDTTFKGYSPAIKGCLCPENIKRFAVNVNSPKIRIPHLNAQSYNSDVISLKAHGLWNDRLKYAFGGTKTGYLTAEHSGQQDRTILDYYTQEFKATPHKLNLLQCSTTMEMGVDIGNIDLVLMTNVPPSSANYMQRAGRAGRRGQSRACAFSMCPNTAIGADVFQNPSKNLTGINPAIKPVVSEIIVKRHANSFFVRQFLLANTNVKFQKVESWLNASGYGDDYVNWLRKNSTNTAMQQEFDEIFDSTRTMSRYITNSINVLQSIQAEYQHTHTDIVSAIHTAHQNGEQAKEHALKNQLIALESQDLKGYLAENLFLPNANMPTGIVEFNHMDKKTAQDLDNKKTRFENLKLQIQQQGIPAGTRINLQNQIDSLEKNIEEIVRRSINTTRTIKIALSEYAPGQTVVINEKNYVSAGIDWKNRFGQANPYKYLYHCNTCGRFEYTANSTLTVCTNCNGLLRNVLFPRNAQPYTVAIEPVQFRTDINKDSTRQASTKKTYFDIQTILTNVDWSNSVPGPLCDIVGNGDAKGEIVFYNPGKGNGFSLCLDCGRMEETTNPPQIGNNWPHNRINELNSNGCPVNNVTNNIVLSGKFPTSFVAMKFYKDSSRNQAVDDEELLYSLGVLLCRALANTIGISRDDIDFDVRKERGFSSIFIYDTTKGGCGYSTRMLDQHICHSVFSEAKTLLSSFNCTCEKYVSGACVNCLVDRNSQRLEKSLSKHKVMAWLAGQTMNLTNSASGTAVSIPLPFLAVQKANDKNTRSMTFCVDASDMRLAEWSQKNGAIGKIIDFAVSKGISVDIVVANVPSVACGAKLEDLIPFVDLPQKFQNWGVIVTAVKTLEAKQGEFSSMIVNNSEHFFTDQPSVLPFTEDWGANCTNLYENQVIPNFVPASFPTLQEISGLMRPDEFTREYTNKGYMNPLHMTVRELFQNIIQGHLLQQGDDDILRRILSGQDVEISFSDSYVNSALASLMFVYLLREFRDHYNFSIAKVNLQFRGPKRNCVNNNWKDDTFITFNFPNAQEADDYTEKLCEDELGITPTFSNFFPDHCRWIRFIPRNGNRYVEFRPDHGIDGGWESSSKYFDLDWLDETTPIWSKRINTVFYLLVKKK